jgi:hypothetical protein
MGTRSGSLVHTVLAPDRLGLAQGTPLEPALGRSTGHGECLEIAQPGVAPTICRISTPRAKPQCGFHRSITLCGCAFQDPRRSWAAWFGFVWPGAEGRSAKSIPPPGLSRTRGLIRYGCHSRKFGPDSSNRLLIRSLSGPLMTEESVAVTEFPVRKPRWLTPRTRIVV